MALTLEATERMEAYRQKQREGKELTLEDMRDIVKTMRQDRSIAAAVSTASKSRSKAKPKPSGDDLLAELEGL